MRQKRAVDTPKAIALGALVIAAAVYLGLRAQTRGDDRDDLPPSPSITARVDTTAVVNVTAAELATLVRSALQRQVAALRTSCLPADGLSPTWSLTFTFDAGGRQIGRGVQEHRDRADPAITRCVLQELAPLQLRPLGRGASTTVAFTLLIEEAADGSVPSAH